MKITIYPIYRIFSVIVALIFFSLACGLGGSQGGIKTPTAAATEKPTGLPILETGVTETPAGDQQDVMVTPDMQVTNSDTLDGMIDNIAADPALANSNTDDVLRRDVVKSLVENTYKEGCTYGFSDVKISKPPKTASSVWVEEWAMSICDKDMTLQITFTPSKGGGTDYEVHKK